ncbi:MAG: ATP-dependent sacrificial sulfur transferase LarE [Eubacteriaceae bacterium]|jgi:uncharacterized protein|nr:ATP-dependent sacrificial sulfur transferase LarE [Eubacteriaceae bacterium]
MDTTLQNKLKKFYSLLEPYNRIALAFSGGVDSTLLLHLIRQMKTKEITPIAVFGSMMPEEEQRDCFEICKNFNVNLQTLHFEPLNLEPFKENHPDRCYHCKHAIFSLIKEHAEKIGADVVVDGTNVDDFDDYRPGLRALEELDILSPFVHSGMTKGDIYALSRYDNLPTATKPAMACLASRIPTGSPITSAKLAAVAKGEAFLSDLGLKQYRLRHLEDTCRIECDESDFERIMQDRQSIIDYLQGLGFKQVHLDLMGYQRGAMNQIDQN